MKLWHVIALMVLLGFGGVIVAQEVRYRGQLADAREQADSLDRMATRLGVTMGQLEVARGSLEVERQEREVSAGAAAQTIQALEDGLEESQAETERLEERMAQLVDPEAQPVLDSLNASHANDVDVLEAQVGVLEGELAEETRLRVHVDSVLFATEAALEDCLCALEQAQVAVDAFEEVTDGRGWASRAWDSVTSPKGLVTITVVGLAAYGAWQLVHDDEEPTYRYPQEPDWAVAVDVPLPWP